MKTYRLNETNSGGYWRLKRKQYKKLHTNGWRYAEPDTSNWNWDPFEDSWWSFDREEDGVPYGWRKYTEGDFETIREAVESFEKLTGEDFFAQGCNCCGVPFMLESTEENDSETISGYDAELVTRRPF